LGRIRGQHIGAGVIALLWLISGYLMLYYAFLLALGRDRPYSLLGTRLYNTIIASGGFPALLTAAAVALAWGLPAVVVGTMLWFMLRVAVPQMSARRKGWTAAIGAGVLMCALHMFSLDGWPWLAMPYLEADDTEFAPTYSAVGFWRVRPGMTYDEVLARAGEPLQRYPIDGHPNEEGWRWTRSPHSADFRVRLVLFLDGRVRYRFSEYYID
jgi:hypothetical protein